MQPVTAGDSCLRSFSISNYPGNGGNMWDRGLFQSGRQIHVLAITDGTSNTFAVGERGTTPVKIATSTAMQFPLAALWAGIDRSQGDPVSEFAIRGSTQYRMQDGATSTGLDEPDQGFSSNHTGGANFAMDDGSVRFVRDSIPFKWEDESAAGVTLTATYSKLGCRDDRQPAGDF